MSDLENEVNRLEKSPKIELSAFTDGQDNGVGVVNRQTDNAQGRQDRTHGGARQKTYRSSQGHKSQYGGHSQSRSSGQSIRVECHACGKLGHIARFCRNTGNTQHRSGGHPRISGNTISALEEVKLNLRILGQPFDIIFIVIPKEIFPADLLLSYWGLVYCKLVIDFGRKLIKLDEASVPFNLAHSDSSLNRARSIHCNSEYDKRSSSENVCKHEHKQVSKRCTQVQETGKKDSNRSMNVDNISK